MPSYEHYWENPTAYRQYVPRGPEICGFKVASIWEAWCGETAWSRAMRRCAELGATCHYWSGVPRSRSAIPLTFAIYHKGKQIDDGKYTLRGLKQAVAYLETYHRNC